jgi:hypothetical protein
MGKGLGIGIGDIGIAKKHHRSPNGFGYQPWGAKWIWLAIMGCQMDLATKIVMGFPENPSQNSIASQVSLATRINHESQLAPT